MPQYTTGEVAKLCNVSVRTVQYYDSRNILNPSELSEGGRRLYSEEDLNKMQIICFLREMGFSIDNIGILLSDEHSENIIASIIEQQEELLYKEIKERRGKLNMLLSMKDQLKRLDRFSVCSLGDIAKITKTRRERKKLLVRMLAVGTVMDAIEIFLLIYGIMTGVWLPLILCAPVIVALGIYISYIYFSNVDYICPNCHTKFHPKIKEAFWASHTPNTRRLTCPECEHKIFCIEVYSKNKKTEEDKCSV